jgi:hypothetical protein
MHAELIWSVMAEVVGILGPVASLHTLSKAGSTALNHVFKLYG